MYYTRKQQGGQHKKLIFENKKAVRRLLLVTAGN